MKNRFYGFLVLLLMVSSFNILQISTSLYAQDTAKIFEDKSLITSFNTNLMAIKHLPNFNLMRKRAKWNFGREFVYNSNDSKSNIFITVGIQQSKKDAENIANDYINDISIRMEKGSHKGIVIGDEFWWWTPNSDSGDLTNIVFIRKNAIFIMSSHNYANLKMLAKVIDEDITKGEPYVTIDSIIPTPEIKSISIKSDTVNDFAKITIDAVDPNNESLEYQFLPGLIKDKNELVNTFTFKTSDNHFNDTSKSQIVKMIVINESNVVSPIFEIKIR
jgi:hypothetical protein